ncbi:tetratricopeptide repeat protein [Cohaesibacter gelatinilyticus]|uniref:Tetratricopeptide repeat-containing protein n=1 Tax=Cohaesibacter gelatinilyticus TaxID=372072 RepID=A0A285NH52_9HYPH|nr:hypothetical protein [Cohaesibacter gelatinilyticus]SNZ08800.1 hypothetical protein SAMN06265368_1820 [Cohaesibacter gelatinilyticus]
MPHKLKSLQLIHILDIKRSKPALKRWGRNLKMVGAGITIVLGMGAFHSHAQNASSTLPVEQVSEVSELKVIATKEDGFGRVILKVVGRNLLPEFSIKQDNSIFVVRFSERLSSSSVTALPRILSDYISIARLDPDGKGIRIAFKEDVRINTMEAGEQLFVDFLPKDWQGLPPALPADVVAELAKRAEEALRLARSLEQADTGSRIQPELDIRIGDHPTFSRIVFGWNIPFDSTFERKGEEVSLFFNHKTDIDLSKVRASLPRLIRDMRLEKDGGKSRFVLTVAGGADVRAFREGNTYIVDVTGDRALFDTARSEDYITRAVSKDGDTGILVAKGMPDPNQPQDLNGLGQAVAKSEPSSGLVLGPGPNGETAKSELFLPDQQVEPARMRPAGETAAPTLPPAALDVTKPASPAMPNAAASADSQSGQQQIIGQQSGNASHGNAERMKGGGADLSSQSLLVETKTFGRSVRLYFPFSAPTAAAVFKKNGVIWAVFDTILELDVSNVRAQLQPIADDVEVWRSGDSAILRIPLKNPRLTTFSTEGYGWLLTIGDLVVEPTKPLHLARTEISGGRAAMRVHFESAGRIIRMRDPGSGEILHVVTGFGPARGFVKVQRLVDFSTLVSAHGIALTEHIDDLQVLRDEDFVYISSNRGLTLSSVGANKKADLSGLVDTDSAIRETFLGLKELQAKTPVIFSKQRQGLERKLSKFDDLMAVQTELALSKLLVANGYAFEALGHLQIMEKSAPEFARGKGFRTLFAATEVFAGRPDEAFRRLNHPEFESDPDASVWLALAAARSGRWREAEEALPRALSVAGDYSDKVRQMLLLDSVEVSVLDQQFTKATAELAEVNPAYLDQEGIARYNLLRGKIAVARNQTSEAHDAFRAAIDTKYLPIANDAWLQDVKLSYQNNEIDNEKAIDELAGLTTIWRGDDVELEALRALAHLYVEKGEYRNAFETSKAAASSDAASDVSRLLQDEMNGVFTSLFLDGKANELPAIKALSLYYDFREMTPVGRRGDEMVRHLADKLVEVDLLDRAAELLSHQVENRLKGAARSQIAADLAVVYLLDSKPNLALDSLRRTRQSQLPRSLERQRRLVEAKALAELNKVTLALDLLKPLDGQDVEQLKADILWRAKRWQETGEQIELMLGDRWVGNSDLDKQEQTNVLRAAVAYSLADDQLGIDRLRKKFAQKMSKTSVAGAFDVVSLPIERGGTQFKAIAQQIAGIDTMERFLDEYRSRYLKKPENAAQSSEAAGDDAQTRPASDTAPADQAGQGNGPNEA